MNQQECMEVGINYEEGVSRFVGNAQLYAHLVALVDALRGEGNLALARTLFPPVAEDYRRAVEFITARLG